MGLTFSLIYWKAKWINISIFVGIFLCIVSYWNKIYFLYLVLIVYTAGR